MPEKFKNAKLINLGLLALALWVGYSAVGMARNTLTLKKEARANEEKIAELTQKKAVLEAFIAELNSKEAVEREAKRRLNLKLPGEEVVVVVPEEKKAETPAKDTAFYAWIKKITIFFTGK